MTKRKERNSLDREVLEPMVNWGKKCRDEDRISGCEKNRIVALVRGTIDVLAR